MGTLEMILLGALGSIVGLFAAATYCLIRCTIEYNKDQNSGR